MENKHNAKPKTNTLPLLKCGELKNNKDIMQKQIKAKQELEEVRKKLFNSKKD